MPSIRLSAVALVILAASPLAGCSHSLDAGWPPGTEAIVSNAAGGLVAAGLPRQSGSQDLNNWVVLQSQIPVVIVKDPVFRTATASATQPNLLRDFVRVRIAKGDRARVEVFVDRRELAPRPGSYAWAISFVPGAVLLLFAAAGFLWMIELAVLWFLRMRSNRTELHLGVLPLQSLATLLWQARKRSRLIERSDQDCERWRQWVAERVARRKAICAIAADAATERVGFGMTFPGRLRL